MGVKAFTIPQIIIKMSGIPKTKQTKKKKKLKSVVDRSIMFQ